MRFEYTNRLVAVANVIEEMNRLGQDGWRVINVRHLDPEFTTPQHEILRQAFRDHQQDQDLVALLFERMETVPT